MSPSGTGHKIWITALDIQPQACVSTYHNPTQRRLNWNASSVKSKLGIFLVYLCIGRTDWSLLEKNPITYYCISTLVTRGFLLSPVNLEIFDVLSVLREAPLPDGVTRAPGRCQSARTAPAHYSAYNLNENATFHQLAAGIFYNTFPEDFSILSVLRLPGTFYNKIIIVKCFIPEEYKVQSPNSLNISIVNRYFYDWRYSISIEGWSMNFGVYCVARFVSPTPCKQYKSVHKLI